MVTLAESGWSTEKNGVNIAWNSWKDKDRIVNYIGNQQKHHRYKTFREEYVEMLQKIGTEFNKKYLS